MGGHNGNGAASAQSASAQQAQLPPLSAAPAPPSFDVQQQKDAAVRPWSAYENAYTETSLPLIRWMPTGYYRFRWLALWPLQWRMLMHMPLLGLVVCSLGELLAVCALLAVGAGWSAAMWGQLSAGFIPSAFLALGVALAGRNNVLTFLLGLSHERAIWWHGLCVAAAVGTGLYHGLIEQLNVDDERSGSSKSDNMKWLITGWVGLGTMAALVATSMFPQLRRTFFNTWQSLHVTVGLLCLICLVIHWPIASIVALAFWGVDLALRFFYMIGFNNPHEVEITALPAGVVRVAWPADHFDYAGGQYVYINIPALSWAQFHPFSVSSTPGEAVAHVHVRALGDWTKQLNTFAQQGVAPGQSKRVRAYIEGPFGTPSIDLYGDRYKAFLLVSGGIGVTPMQAIFNQLMSQRTRGRPVRVARFAWSVRERAMVPQVADDLKVPSPSTPVTHSANASSSPIKAQISDGALQQQKPPQLPMSFQPSLVPTGRYLGGFSPGDVEATQAHEHEDHILAEFYLTPPRTSTEVRNGSASAAQGSRHFAGPADLLFGRPDVAALLRDTGSRAAAVGETRVAVCVCGPRGMVDEVQAKAAELSKAEAAGGVVFDVHAEVFEF